MGYGKDGGAMNKYEMRLSSAGNPDFGQYAPVSEPETVQGDTLEEMRAHCLRYIEFWSLGGGNWKDPVVKEGKKAVGRFSYNGRLWKGRKYCPNAEEILLAKEAKA